VRDYRRRLPHFQASGRPLFVTWCLAQSLPAERNFAPGHLTNGQAFVAMDRLLEETREGYQFLRQPEIAEMVVENIKETSGYELHAYVVMPNHAHILVTPETALGGILRILKGRTARFANQILGRSGTFWQDESYDRIVRDAAEFGRTVNYIELNPVRAGLASTPEGYRWSSAWRD